jgi:hypothetical protein
MNMLDDPRRSVLVNRLSFFFVMPDIGNRASILALPSCPPSVIGHPFLYRRHARHRESGIHSCAIVMPDIGNPESILVLPSCPTSVIGHPSLQVFG